MNLCPAFANPDSVNGCIAATMAETVKKLDYAVNGISASPGVLAQPGIAETLKEFIQEYRRDKRKKMTTSNKIAVMGIIIVLLSWPATQVWTFVVDVYHVTQEWHMIHKTEIEQHKLPSSRSTGQTYTAHSNQQQDAIFQRLQSVR